MSDIYPVIPVIVLVVLVVMFLSAAIRILTSINGPLSSVSGG